MIVHLTQAALDMAAPMLAAGVETPTSPQFLIPHWAWVAFCFALGASVGSFLTVVISRMPLGLSLVRPRSRCPVCLHRLPWYDNLPLVTWLLLGGRCRYCRTKIGAIYPMIELASALLFAGWYYVNYMTDMRPAFGGPGMQFTGILFLPGLFLLAILVACTFIDARHWIIPIQLPNTAAAAALILMPLGVAVSDASVISVSLPPTNLSSVERRARVYPMYSDTAEVYASIENGVAGSVRISAAPLVNAQQAMVGVGAMLGLVVANLLMYLGVFPQSFDHVQEDETGGPETWTPHPHPRREVMKEVMFIAPATLGGLIGYAVGDPAAEWSATTLTLCGVLLGYVAGGAVVWILRILGTLGFGKEAMGLGDVHLMAGVGAVIGWQGAIAAFFIAPFFGILYVLVMFGVTIVMKWEMKEIPFGPHLALATVVVMFGYDAIVGGFMVYWHTITTLLGL